MTAILATSDPPVYPLPPYKVALLARPCRTCGARLESLSRGKSYCSDECRSSSRQESGGSRWWTPEHDALVIEMYAVQDCPIEDIAEAVGRTVDSVLVRTSTLGIMRPKVPRSPAGSLEKLLDESPEAAYWVGFIFADGSISENNRLKVTLKSADRGHLEKLASFVESQSNINYERSARYSTYAHMDSVSVPRLKSRFDLRPRKTYNPPAHLPYQDKELLKCFLIGFIDGDGHIKKQTGRRASAIRTVSHLSWAPFLEELALQLQIGRVKERSGSVRSVGTYAEWFSMRHSDNVALKEFATAAKLPILCRKWGRIDTSYVADRYQKAEQLRELIRMGQSDEEIASLIGVKVRSVYASRSRMKADALRGDSLL